MDRIRALIRGYEGKSKHVYLDSEGNWTVGCGHFLTDEERLNVLTHPLWTDREIETLFEHDFKTALEDFAAVFGQQEMAEARKGALVDMLFNMGRSKFLKFYDMIPAVRRGDWELAAKECLDSRRARKLKARSAENAEMLRTGEWPDAAARL